MLLLEFVLHSLMDLVLWIGGKGLDRSRSARRIAAFRRGEPVTLRCRYRMGGQGPAMRRGNITLRRSGVFLNGPGANGLRLSGPAAAATGGGRGGTALTCTAEAAGRSGTAGGGAELLILTWDAEMVKLITDTMAVRA
ncbi:hypothetical protein [Streptomyces sp. TRM49041]|uniref:hypothetical protein n=1 Tax=Streptomyces sp. TRM49041 TaxID=2603216 RepID=UPI0011EC39CD|nr:hypothetical protein [Streptomyces sp. TRM49041]